MRLLLPFLLLTSPAPTAEFAQIPSAPQATAGPSVEVAREAATAAVTACSQLGYRIMATVVDADGRPVSAMAAGPDVTAALAPDSVRSAQDAAYFRNASSLVVKQLMEEPTVSYAMRAHPQLAPPTPGGWPLAVGAIGVAGAPDGDTDEQCARAGAADVEQ
ncbi:MAG TPA: heme-binding protein [Caulobacteraceae bacterium]|jgi:uncharacterized protein GlcG (DUF336 family)